MEGIAGQLNKFSQNIFIPFYLVRRELVWFFFFKSDCGVVSCWFVFYFSGKFLSSVP